MSAQSLWERYQAHLVRYTDLGIWLDVSRMRFGDGFFDAMTGKAEEAFAGMTELEAGAIANPNENRIVEQVRKDRDRRAFDVEPGVTSGDYLQGFLRETRSALYENGRDSITISIPHVDAFTVGALIALYERAVGFYGSLVNVNAYHQPGVEAGKKAAARILALQGKVTAVLEGAKGAAKTLEELAAEIRADPEDVFHFLNHMAANASKLEHLYATQPGQETFRFR
jgi:glucose-6-phosphate isomerase